MATSSVLPVRHVPDAERRARLGVRHLLAPDAQASDPVGVAAALVGLHATEPASVHLSCWARTPRLTTADVDRAFYADKTLVRQLSLRTTLFGVEPALLPALHGSICRRMAARLRHDLARTAQLGGLADDGTAWVERARAAVLAELDRGEPLSAREVRERVPEAAALVPQGRGATWASMVQLAPRVINLLHLEGRLARCGNDGDWRVSRPRWTTTARWLGADVVPLAEQDGYTELVRRWLRSYGPGTVSDAAWWLGSTKGVVRTALRELAAVPVSLDGLAEPGWLLPDDADPVAAPGPWVALLPVLDPTIMGWRDRRFALGGHAPQLFDSVGNAGTTAWADGRVVGVWVQDDAGRVRVRLLEDVPPSPRDALQEAAAQLTAWLGGQRVFSVYPSPAMVDAAR